VTSRESIIKEEQSVAATGTATDIQEKHQKTIADYVGDMVALESHIEEALDRQLEELKDDAVGLAAVREFHDMVKRHRDELIALQEATGQTAGSPIKEAGAALLGDYAAFSLAAISYSMLFTTSTGLGDSRVAAIAQRNLQDYAGAIIRINEVMPTVVVNELRKDGHQVQEGAIEATRKMVGWSWNSQE
jgi:ABC-type Fe3+/spermidine/putrescine transport system ATPase subunit